MSAADMRVPFGFAQGKQTRNPNVEIRNAVLTTVHTVARRDGGRNVGMRRLGGGWLSNLQKG
jgi:hypothetical protein